MYTFISHSSNDAEYAEKVCTLLEDAGHQCFIAPRDIRSGREYAEELILGIERSDAMVLMLSNAANSSPHVLREVEHAASRGIPILVYKLEEVTLTKSMEYFLMTHQWVNQKPNDDIRKILQCITDMQEDTQFDRITNAKENAEKASKKEVKTDSAKSTAKNSIKKVKHNFPFAPLAIMAVLAAVVIYSVNGIRGTKKDALGKADIQLGGTVTMGEYNGEPVSWRVIHLSEDENRAVLITEHIITMKAYDAAESERFNADNGNDYWKLASESFADKTIEAKVRGNNEWGNSCIRTWLNSDAQIVSYEGGAPSGRVMSDMKNGYEQEAGFLYGFTQKERAAVVETEIKSKGNVLSADSTLVTNDKVFLLDIEELDWLKDAGVSIFAKPTEAALNQDATKWYDAYSLDLGTDSYFWWLREPVEGRVSECYTVTNGYTADMVTPQTVGVEGFGIRPAVTVDLQALTKLANE